MFKNCSNFTYSIYSWDISNVKKVSMNIFTLCIEKYKIILITPNIINIDPQKITQRNPTKNTETNLSYIVDFIHKLF
tara:strand:- start:65 stop:295 length:231 start_codon:yes stop_codon:yes gene_type:complete